MLFHIIYDYQQVPLARDIRNGVYDGKRLGTKDGRRGTILPSNNTMLSIAFLIVLSVVLCLVGYDYISPSSTTLNFASYRKRAFVPYGISKAFWTSGNRFGYMAFAMTPLVVLFALKAPPFAFLSLHARLHICILTSSHCFTVPPLGWSGDLPQFTQSCGRSSCSRTSIMVGLYGSLSGIATISSLVVLPMG